MKVVWKGREISRTGFENRLRCVDPANPKGDDVALHVGFPAQKGWGVSIVPGGRTVRGQKPSARRGLFRSGDGGEKKPGKEITARC